MPDIRFVCLSDTHFGADNSLLTYLGPEQRKADPMRTSPVLEQFVLCLRTLVSSGRSKPTLVLNGDILELALAKDHQAGMAFERFLDLAFPKGGEALFQDRIFYLPGNHDHHLWETTREAQYLAHLADPDESPPHERIKAPWHATNMFLERRKKESRTCSAQLLNTLAQRRGLNQLFFEVAYPNLGFVSDDQRRAVLFTHGHFAESLYTLVTQLATLLFPKRTPPTDVWDLEMENFAWIDFFWSALGRSGGAGEEVEVVYDKMQSPAALAELLQGLSRELVRRFVPRWLPLVGGLGVRAVLRALLEHVSKPEARKQGDGPLTPETRDGLEKYVRGPLLSQIKGELKSEPPAEVALVFGHTHKPFEQVVSYAGYGEDVRIYNSGGWVVDTLKVTDQAGWAVILVDEALNVASVRGAGDAPGTGVRVAQAGAKGAPPNPLCQQLTALIDSHKAPWTNFAKELEASIANHKRNLENKIKE
jgi:hypothetical protein